MSYRVQRTVLLAPQGTRTSAKRTTGSRESRSFFMQKSFGKSQIPFNQFLDQPREYIKTMNGVVYIVYQPGVEIESLD